MTTRVPFKALIPLPIALLLVSVANAELGLSGTLSAVLRIRQQCFC